MTEVIRSRSALPYRQRKGRAPWRLGPQSKYDASANQARVYPIADPLPLAEVRVVNLREASQRSDRGTTTR